MDEARYHKVLRASSLRDDLRQLPNGDLTVRLFLRLLNNVILSEGYSILGKCLGVVMLRRLNPLISERGVTLSGGQRARVSVARALYSGADIIIFE